MKLTKVSKLKVVAAAASITIFTAGCGLLGGGNENLSVSCETATRELAAQYVTSTSESTTGGLQAAVKAAELNAAELTQQLAAQCEGDSISDALSLFVVTANSSIEQKVNESLDGNLQQVLYSGISHVCVVEVPTFDAVLSDAAQQVCDQEQTNVPSADELGAVEPIDDGIPEYTLMYALEGAGQASVTFLNADGVEQKETVQLPWAWEGQATLPLPSMSAVTIGPSQAICAIFVNGERRAEGAIDSENGSIVCNYDTLSMFAPEVKGLDVSTLPPEIQGAANDFLAGETP